MLPTISHTSENQHSHGTKRHAPEGMAKPCRLGQIVPGGFQIKRQEYAEPEGRHKDMQADERAQHQPRLCRAGVADEGKGKGKERSPRKAEDHAPPAREGKQGKKHKAQGAHEGRCAKGPLPDKGEHLHVHHAGRPVIHKPSSLHRLLQDEREDGSHG